MYKPTAAIFTIDSETGKPFYPVDHTITFPPDCNDVCVNTLGKSMWKVVEQDSMTEYAVLFPGLKNLPDRKFIYTLPGVIFMNNDSFVCDDKKALIYIMGQNKRCDSIMLSMSPNPENPESPVPAIKNE